MKTQNHLCILGKIVAVAAVCSIFQNARATLLFDDAFNYTAGSTLGGNINPGNSIAWTGTSTNMTIVGGNLSYSGLQALGGNQLSMAWSVKTTSINTFANITSGQIYYSFLLDMTTPSGGNDYLTALNPGTVTPGGSRDAVDIYVDSSSNLRLRTVGASETTAAALSLNTTYLVVLEYDFDTANASLFLNPVAGDSQPVATASVTGDGSVAGIDNVGFVSQATTGDFLIDDIRVGTTWADVTPVPEPSTLALAGLGALGLLAKFRRR